MDSERIEQLFDKLFDKHDEAVKDRGVIKARIASLEAKQVTQPCADMASIKGNMWRIAGTLALGMITMFGYFKWGGK